MCTINEFLREQSIGFFALIALLTLWDAIWKLIALWHAAQRKQLVWFIGIAVLNTVGILPIIYLLKFRKPQ